MRIAPFIIGLFFCVPSWSQEANRTLRQLSHKAWTAADGAPAAIQSITQTADGMLWLASASGLFQFDGVRFTRYTGSADQPLPSNNVEALAAWPDSGLWIGCHFGGIGVLKDGRLTLYDERDGLPEGTIRFILRDPDGVIWVLARGGLARLRGSHWEKVPFESDDPTSMPRAALFDPSGTLWVMTTGELLAKKAHDSLFKKQPLQAREAFPVPLATAPDGTIWASYRSAGLVRMRSSTDPQAGFTVVAPGVNRSLLFDREGNLWMGESDIQRISRRELQSGSTANPSHFQTFSTADGLTGLVNSFFEDREGNIWVATEGGLDRFSVSNIIKVEMPPKSYVPALAAADSGAVWMTYLSSPTSGGIKVIRGSTPEDFPIPVDDGFSYAYQDPDGSMWFGGVKSLLHVQGEHHSVVRLPVYSDLSGVRAMVRDRAGGLWVSIAAHGLFRFFKGRWSTNGELPALPRDAPIVATADAGGRLWFGYTKSRVARVEGSSVRLFDPADGLDLGHIKAFETHGQDIWVAGERGLARLNDRRFVKIHASNDDAFTGISGLVARANGDLWASGHMGLIHIPRGELEHARKDPSYPVQYESFNYLDGLPGTVQQVFPLPSLIEGKDGRLWLSLHGDEGVAWIDPNNIYRNSLPPPVSILSVSSAGRRFTTTPDILPLPIGTTSLQIQYMAGSLSIPERVHFRYRLEGSDSGWQDAGNRREAFYTNLAPGAYRFRVIAANNDGVWNNAGASIQLFIKPAFYQTRWFHAACMLVFLLLLLALHRVRLKAVRAEASGRLEERLAERERIARELHDTLLQSIQGLMLRFQAASERLPQHEPARLQMESALVRAEKVMHEGRHRVKNLRTADSGVKNFVGALNATGELFSQNSAARFHASVEGAERDLHPIVQEEVLLIAREALANAFRHAQARAIEAQISYNATELYVRICDDGVGIDPDILNRGRPGHWGLAGMHERAKNIGAQFTLSSEPAGGTAVELRIPADVVYQSQPRRTQKPFWRTERRL